MLTGFTWCIPLKTKTAEEVAKAFLDHIFHLFGGSVKILMDNGMEFKNRLFKEVIGIQGMEFSIHSPPYRPQSNGKIEGFHRFLKACIAKHINHGLEWDELTPMATACYNFFPNCSARESAFLIMFRRDPINKLDMMLHAARRYFIKKCIPRGYIPDLDWTTIYEDLDQPIRPVKQEEDPNETTTTPAAPPDVEGPPSSHLRSKTNSKPPPYSRDNWNAIHQQWTHWNTILESPKSNQSIIETKLLCLIISMYVVDVNYCVQGSKAYEALVIV